MGTLADLAESGDAEDAAVNPLVWLCVRNKRVAAELFFFAFGAGFPAWTRVVCARLLRVLLFHPW